MTTFIVTAEPTKLNSIANHTWNITFNTSEGSDNIAILAKYLNQQGTLAFKVGEFSEVEVGELPEVKDPSAPKSQAQRLRAVFYRLWEKTDKKISSEQHYREMMERVIEFYKEKLD